MGKRVIRLNSLKVFRKENSEGQGMFGQQKYRH